MRCELNRISSYQKRRLEIYERNICPKVVLEKLDNEKFLRSGG